MYIVHSMDSKISNLNTQELLMCFVIVLSQLFNCSAKPNVCFLIKTSKTINIFNITHGTCTAPWWQF